MSIVDIVLSVSPDGSSTWAELNISLLTHLCPQGDPKAQDLP